MNQTDELAALKLMQNGVLPALAKEVVEYRAALLAAGLSPTMANRLTEEMHSFLCASLLPARWQWEE